MKLFKVSSFFTALFIAILGLNLDIKPSYAHYPPYYRHLDKIEGYQFCKDDGCKIEHFKIRGIGYPNPSEYFLSFEGDRHYQFKIPAGICVTVWGELINTDGSVAGWYTENFLRGPHPGFRAKKADLKICSTDYPGYLYHPDQIITREQIFSYCQPFGCKLDDFVQMNPTLVEYKTENINPTYFQVPEDMTFFYRVPTLGQPDPYHQFFWRVGEGPARFYTNWVFFDKCGYKPGGDGCVPKVDN